MSRKDKDEIERLRGELAVERDKGVRLSYEEAWPLVRALIKAGWDTQGVLGKSAAHRTLRKLELFCAEIQEERT